MNWLAPTSRLRAALCLRKTTAQGVRCGLRTVGTADFGEDVAHVGGHGIAADEQGVGDLPVALARGHQAQHVDLAWTEVVQVHQRE